MLQVTQYFHPWTHETGTIYSLVTCCHVPARNMTEAKKFMERTRQEMGKDLLGFMVWNPADIATIKKPLFCDAPAEARSAVGF